MATAVIVGAGVAGLGAALGLASKGHSVTVVEQDRSTTASSGIEAFASWERPHVPQFRQPHTILARARNILLDRAPEVVTRLHDDGIEEVNFIRMFTPPERQRPEDDDFTAWMTRRPAFELAMRRTVEATTDIDLRDDVIATGLLLDDRTDDVAVNGIVTDDGTLAADVVIDAGGRRSPMCRWVREAGAEIPEHVQDCELTYHSRNFELTSDSELVLPMLALLRLEIPGLTSITFPGEHRTFSLCLIPPTWDDELKLLRHEWAWDAAAQTLPALRQWLDPSNATPVGGVATMAGHRNVLRELVVDGRPVVLGVLPVGDALCTTNPANGWGVSMALTTAFAAVDAIDAADGDPVQQALRYHDSVHDEVEEVYVESSALDRLRRYRWRSEDVPEFDSGEAERALLIRALWTGAMRDIDLGRELLRRVNLLQSPRETLADPDLRQRVTAIRDQQKAAPSSPGPTRDDIVAAIRARQP